MASAAETAVELSGVSVRYRIASEAVHSLKEYAIRKLRGRIEHGQLLALNGVSVVIQPGERVGIIGPNGAGKSTLFRVIARVRRPSAGRIVVRGQVAPLLELGLGFHGELTGRENVVLHGTLMGRSRREMLDRMDRIAEFAELEAFLDTPIRNYSTGMTARLAFAAATDIDPDVLLVDEALAVGDERFRAKCHARMSGFRDRGKTFLLVSHLLDEVRETCTRALWLSDGKIVRDGPAVEVVEAYQRWARGDEGFGEVLAPG
jgi:ABC-type polysaccharide/polyol phosphate transport system ATPase subunit